MPGIKVPKCHFILSVKLESNLSFCQDLCPSQNQLHVGAYYYMKCLTGLKSEGKWGSYVLLSIPPLDAGRLGAERRHPAQLTHLPTPLKAKSRAGSQEGETPGTKVTEMKHGSD